MCSIAAAILVGCVSGPIGAWLAVRFAYPILAKRWPDLYG